jgi:lantibiotic modifying enzyme
VKSENIENQISEDNRILNTSNNSISHTLHHLPQISSLISNLNIFQTTSSLTNQNKNLKFHSYKHKKLESDQVLKTNSFLESEKNLNISEYANIRKLNMTDVDIISNSPGIMTIR